MYFIEMPYTKRKNGGAIPINTDLNYNNSNRYINTTIPIENNHSNHINNHSNHINNHSNNSSNHSNHSNNHSNHSNNHSNHINNHSNHINNHSNNHSNHINNHSNHINNHSNNSSNRSNNSNYSNNYVEPSAQNLANLAEYEYDIERYKQPIFESLDNLSDLCNTQPLSIKQLYNILIEMRIFKSYMNDTDSYSLSEAYRNLKYYYNNLKKALNDDYTDGFTDVKIDINAEFNDILRRHKKIFGYMGGKRRKNRKTRMKCMKRRGTKKSKSRRNRKTRNRNRNRK